jgi:quercetin dioxygenase-like cupin family protein
MSQAVCTNWSDLPIEAMNPLLGRQFVVGANVMVARILLERGAHVPLHSHLHEQIAIPISGCLQFFLHETESAPREVILRPNEVLTIPPHLPHEVFALEDTVNLDIFSPPRQDWIDGVDAYLRVPRA